MNQRSSSTRAQRTGRQGAIQRKGRLTIGRQGDRFEQEADRAAESIAEGRAPSFAFSRVPVQRTQRDEKAAPKTDEEKYADAAKKIGEAFLETPPGKEIKEKAERLGDTFVATLPGKVITGAAITGAVAGLAAAHKELPLGVPDIPLDKVRPGLTMKITYEGPVDKPTRVSATFSFKLGAQASPTQKPPTESEKYRAETAKLQEDLFKFKQGAKSPEERAAEERALNTYLNSKLKSPLMPLLPPKGTTGVGVTATPAQAQPKAPASGTELPPQLKVTGESDKPSQEPKKEDEESDLRRKASGDSDLSTAPPIVDAVLGSSGSPLDPATRLFMESRFGFDFSSVRVHTGSLASDSARAVEAVAYTVGHDVVFGSGTFSPNTIEGRKLLAHELTHIIQQENLPAVGVGDISARDASSIDSRTLRRKTNPGTQPDPLAKALKGDDDDVRDLTKHSSWNAIDLTPAQAALLIIELLKGATLDDDEKAGLAILRKMIAKNLLDESLESLNQADRFEQLLDDYHGSEYRDLLELLSTNIKKKNVRALLLDTFIAMWWLNSAEERAVVVLLEGASVEDRIPLLGEKDRVKELRGDIGNKSLAMRFEAVVASAGEKRWEIVSNSLTAIFTIQATQSVGKGQRTKEETDQLLKKAAADLAAELLDYKHKIAEAQKKKDAKPKDVAEINKEFKRRLDKLIEDKKAEFGLELKYNIEFNRLLDVAWGKQWFQEDLKEIDDILAKIPYDILHLNIGLQAFERSLSDPERESIAGMHTGPGIQLRGGLSLGITAHELGHSIDDSNPALATDFNKLSEWSSFNRAGLAKLVPDDKERTKLEGLLDADYDKSQKDKNFNGDPHAYGDYIYRFARYGDAGDYVRHHKSAKFIRTYASTDPKDDFADSFGYMFSDPESLQKQCPEKYEFMLTRVLIDYRLSAQKKPVLDEFDLIFKSRVLNGWNFETDLKDKYIQPMRKSLEEALDKSRTAQVGLAKKNIKSKPTPIPLDSGVSKVAQPLLEQARRLSVITKAPIVAYGDLRGVITGLSLFEIPKDLDEAYADLVSRLDKELRAELLAYIDPLATQVLAGKDVSIKATPEVDAIHDRYAKSISVIKPYLPEYRDALEGEPKLFRHLIDILTSIRDKKRRERVRVKIVALRAEAKADFEKWMTTAAEHLRNGQPFNKKLQARPTAMLATYKAKATKIKRETK